MGLRNVRHVILIVIKAGSGGDLFDLVQVISLFMSHQIDVCKFGDPFNNLIFEAYF